MMYQNIRKVRCQFRLKRVGKGEVMGACTPHGPLGCVCWVQATVEPWYNEPLYNEVLGAANDFFYPSNSKIYEKEPRYNKTLISKQILPIPWLFIILRFHCSCLCCRFFCLSRTFDINLMSDWVIVLVQCTSVCHRALNLWFFCQKYKLPAACVSKSMYRPALYLWESLHSQI